MVKVTENYSEKDEFEDEEEVGVGDRCLCLRIGRRGRSVDWTELVWSGAEDGFRLGFSC